MLSAVAARKAALAAHQDLTKPLPSPKVVSPPPTPTPASPKKTVSKRKPPAQVPNTSSRKAKKTKTKHEKARYFAADDAFVQQDDVIVVDEDSSESEADEIMDQDDSLFAGSSKPVVFQRPTTSKDKRAWSPSHLLQDSSDESMDDGEDEPFVQNIPITTSLPRAIVEEERPLLSSFEPNWNNNIFALSPAEISSLESSNLVGDSAIVIILTPGETLSLLGAYALTVMYGSVYLAGVTLHSSQTIHHVFAPRCSPVPALQCFQSNGKTRDPKPVSLPGRVHPFLNADCAVVVLRKLCTGVEGLGRVCRTFEGVFEPSRWHRNDSAPDLGLTGVRMVQFNPNSHAQ
jgi:polynucleotide 5'-hydroxyl-kinase GRC3/NOL9